MGKDYYKILGIPRDATDQQIKRAYYKLAQKWHPDKNPSNKEVAETKFKEIGEAYCVLKDKEKKRLYDQFGEEGLKGTPSSGPSTSQDGFTRTTFSSFGTPFTFTTSDAFDIFSDFFGHSDPSDFFTSAQMGGMESAFGGSGFRARATRPHQPPPIVRDLTCSLEELFSGATKHIKITKKVLIDDSHTQQQAKTLDVPIKAGWKEGTKLTYHKEGDQGPGIIPADIVFVIKQRPHARFERIGNDLVTRLKIRLLDSLTGFTGTVKTLDGRILHIAINTVVNPKFEKRIVGEGMPISKMPGSRGDLIIRFDIVFPQHLTEEQKVLLRRAFRSE
ncbi:Chaperone protein dnaJ [Aduncisulcus paluster]|uniref:Chaperone protein dnaJ n=1 Tax=Aduncisulcus paluster TaxID=2918883 RepID=A0ABQ5K6M5_9EUKA|nr:Chaperone protein dnaJ [Aduncisulcus paluster]|eukprot:gnl/Carplike_NY0171/245_a353_4019.p1 GENE.gnl/Carplike_NY0171/245_a353_4019~~gnl/Carplike_NY0171/245_a353_4019.p1  ORF type:complete len:345 (+),score=76.68 gnl/Carplike_NY0171/245_a353_4019:40-1035(+)